MSSIDLFVARDLTEHIDFLIILLVGSYAMIKIYLHIHGFLSVFTWLVRHNALFI